MSSGKPIIKQISWFSVIAQILLVFLLIKFLEFLNFSSNNSLIITWVIFVSAALFLRNTIARHHRKGMRLVRAGKYKEAILEFEKSLEFFSKYSWVDKLRFITILSSSRITYKEMALVNIAFSYTQIGKGKLAKEYYEKALELFPDSQIAKSALNMILSVENSSKES